MRRSPRRDALDPCINERETPLPISSVRRRQWRLLGCSSIPVVPTSLKIEIRVRLRGELPRLWRVYRGQSKMALSSLGKVHRSMRVLDLTAASMV